MPQETMVAAQRRTIVVPLLVITSLAVGLSATLVAPLVGMAMVTAPLSVLVIVGTVVAGVALVLGAVAVARPVLRQVLAPGRV